MCPEQIVVKRYYSTALIILSQDSNIFRLVVEIYNDYTVQSVIGLLKIQLICSGKNRTTLRTTQQMVE